jgi:hypothetical protein
MAALEAATQALGIQARLNDRLKAGHGEFGRRI